MLAAYRPLMRSSSGLCLSTLTDGISMYAKQEEYVYFSQISDNHNFHASTSNNHKSLSIRYNNPLRRNDNIHKQYLRRISSDGTRRKLLLKAGRARRKMQLKQSTHKKSATSKHDERNNSATPPEEKLLNSNIDDDYHEKKSVSPKDILFGVPMDNPLRERYIRSQQKINYPKTWNGWKEVFRKTKDTYLWTFEGFLLPEKKRDEHGNIIPDNEDDADEEDVDKNTTIKDKARDAANQMAGNLQNNISTIQQEAPKLLRMGQEVTGISSREELRAWVGEQLKLGTACLTEFMKGYRSGRDDEVDKMLHEYFKDLDEEKNETSAVGEERNEADANTGDIHTRSPKRERRSWGRNERRRTKAMSSTTRATSLSINE